MGEPTCPRESFDDEVLTEDGEMIDCPSCQGWDASETGCVCLLCDGDGVIWNPGAVRSRRA